jgi:hypothetical protein
LIWDALASLATNWQSIDTCPTDPIQHDKAMKPNFRISANSRTLTCTLLAAIAAIALLTAQAGEPSIPEVVLNKIDAQIVLALKQSRGQPPFDRPTSLHPDIPMKINGRIGVEMRATVSPELVNKVAVLGGQVFKESPTALQAWVPLQQVETLAACAEVKFISPVRPIGTSRVNPGDKH